MAELTFRDFTHSDEVELRTLIQNGLGQRFGTIDESLNPDLHTLYDYYTMHGVCFLVTESDSEIVGCGALIREHGSSEIARIVRVSVRQDQQGKGIGRAISQRLIDVAKANGFKRLLVETNSDWDSALRLYQLLGFQEEQRLKSEEFDFIEVHMAMLL
ncbi:MAG TPA: GNAT family N-acetyltransferase [Phototrophicaceae bacterium]|nr:GNAT family N-acetyltransferase [Phototrophicaceae bacterium]